MPVKIGRCLAGLAAGTSVMGVLGGLLWWFVWWYWGIPALSVLLVVLIQGFVTASIFFYLPISKRSPLNSNSDSDSPRIGNIY